MTREKRPWWHWAALVFALWTVLALTFAALSYGIAVSNGTTADFPRIVAQHLTRFYVWAALTPFIYRFARRFPLAAPGTRARRLLLHLPAVAALSLAHHVVFIAASWRLGLVAGAQATSFAAVYRLSFFGAIYSAILVSGLVLAASHALVFYRQSRENESRAAELRVQLARAELRALKMQLHPHFLFNTLHSISSLVLEDPPRANRMIARLGDFLRLTLEQSERGQVPLREELEFVRCYLEIEQARFEDRLTVIYEIEPAALAALVPHLILQPVVENAIHYAVAPRAARSHVKIFAARAGGQLRLEVRDDGPGLRDEPGSGGDPGGDGKGGLGLSNVRARLGQAYGGGGRLRLENVPGGGLSVSLLLPFETNGAGESQEPAGENGSAEA